MFKGEGSASEARGSNWNQIKRPHERGTSEGLNFVQLRQQISECDSPVLKRNLIINSDLDRYRGFEDA